MIGPGSNKNNRFWIKNGHEMNFYSEEFYWQGKQHYALLWEHIPRRRSWLCDRNWGTPDREPRDEDLWVLLFGQNIKDDTQKSPSSHITWAWIGSKSWESPLSNVSQKWFCDFNLSFVFCSFRRIRVHHPKLGLTSCAGVCAQQLEQRS